LKKQLIKEWHKPIVDDCTSSKHSQRSTPSKSFGTSDIQIISKNQQDIEREECKDEQ
jgi:hypothetical protein